jgi:pimeloyl-ACP methyl ester carboxylesterase
VPGLGAWRAGGRTIDFVGAPVFACGAGRPAAAGGAAALFLHGAAGSSYDFARLWPRLGRRRALGAFDFAGFGRSGAAPGFGFGVADQADVALAAAASLGLGRAHLVAHDVGGAVAAELLARRERGRLPLVVESVTFVGGGPLGALRGRARLLRWVRRLAAGGRAARALSLALFRWAFARGLGDPHVTGEAEAAEAWALFVEGPGGPHAEAALGFGDELARPPARWWAALARLDLPALVLWGGDDRVARAEHARRLGRLVPGARVCLLPGLGHAPHLEAPGAVAAELEAFWGDVEGA